MASETIQLSLLFLAICTYVGYAKPPSRIIDAQESYNIPYQVSIQDNSRNNFCGGAILDASHILTAAHCIVDDDKLPFGFTFDVVIGTNDKNDRKPENVFQIIKKTIHEDFDPRDSWKNDIAVLRLQTRINRTATSRAYSYIMDYADKNYGKIQKGSSAWTTRLAQTTSPSGNFNRIPGGEKIMGAPSSGQDACLFMSLYVIHEDIQQLDRNITFNANRSAIELPISDAAEGTEVMSSGWGAIKWSDLHSQGDGYPRYLRYYYGVVISQDHCQEEMVFRKIHPGHICIWSNGKGTSCQGDSGNPLVDDNQIIGITAFNNFCNTYYPDVFTRVYYYLEWIRNAMND